MKRPSNEALVNGLLGVALLLGLLWLMRGSEWVEVLTRQPMQGEAARDEFYALKRLLEKLGAQVVSPDSLEQMPPPGATLVLNSRQWDFAPERQAQLRDWVQGQGGHLVLPQYFIVGHEDIDWLPLRQVSAPPKRNASGAAGADADDLPLPGSARGAVPPDFVGPLNLPRQQCPAWREWRADAAMSSASAQASAMTSDAAAAPRTLRLCIGDNQTALEATPGTEVLWRLSGRSGAVMLRVAAGRGRVTAIAPYGLFMRRTLLMGQHALAAVAALDLRAGQTIWIVSHERREALPQWVWARAAPVLLCLALALALWMWRRAPRFGPLESPAPPSRRSMAEQIRGTAAFVLRGGGAALLRAARRALDHAARTRLPGWDACLLGERCRRLAEATGVSEAALQRWLDPRAPAAPARATAEGLAVLETARRRLLRKAAA